MGPIDRAMAWLRSEPQIDVHAAPAPAAGVAAPPPPPPTDGYEGARSAVAIGTGLSAAAGGGVGAAMSVDAATVGRTGARFAQRAITEQAAINRLRFAYGGAPSFHERVRDAAQKMSGALKLEEAALATAARGALLRSTAAGAVVGGVIAVAKNGAAYASGAIDAGDALLRTAQETAISAAAAAGGAYVGAKVGAAVGSAVTPGVGTAVGALVGFGTGCAIAYMGQKQIE